MSKKFNNNQSINDVSFNGNGNVNNQKQTQIKSGNPVDKSNTTNVIHQHHYHLTEEQKEEKRKKEEAPRYGLRKYYEEGTGCEVIAGSALVRLDEVKNIKIKGKLVPHYRFLNVHDIQGNFLSDHIHVVQEDVVKAFSFDLNMLNPLILVIFFGRVYNYNDNRLDGLSINIKDSDGGKVYIQHQVFDVEKQKNSMNYDLEKEDLNDIKEFIHNLNEEEMLKVIEILKDELNKITFRHIGINSIFNYIFYSYFLEISHKSLYLNTIKLEECDYNVLLDLIILLASTLCYILKSDSVKIHELFKYIGYNLMSIQGVYNFEDYNSDMNYDFRTFFEPMIRKEKSWEVIKYRIRNLGLNWRECFREDEVFMEACKYLYFHKPIILSRLK